MEYRTLGQTQLQVSVLGFGASPLGDVFGVTDPKEGHRAVHLAIDEGINLFDVSPYYGLTLAEERLGTALTGRRHEVVLATKCGRYGLDVFDFSAIRIQQSIDESLRRLRTDYVDLYQVHDVEFGDIEQIIEETIPTMRRIQEAGKARYIGITGYPLSVLMRIAARIPVDTILSYCRYNLLVDDLGRELIPFAEQSGIGIINASALHMGLLADGDPPDWHPAPRIIRSAARQAANFCRAHGSNISEIALRFSLDSPHVASTLVGMCTVEQVRSSLWALGGPADADMTQQVRNILAPALNYVWPSGRPENHEPNC
jgi:L-galactose dehydrogenase